jgi:hypothetical protein
LRTLRAAERSAVRVEMHPGQRALVLSLVAVTVALAAGQAPILAAMRRSAVDRVHGRRTFGPV